MKVHWETKSDISRSDQSDIIRGWCQESPKPACLYEKGNKSEGSKTDLSGS